jgi:hypothetical protein
MTFGPNGSLDRKVNYECKHSVKIAHLFTSAYSLFSNERTKFCKYTLRDVLYCQFLNYVYSKISNLAIRRQMVHGNIILSCYTIL